MGRALKGIFFYGAQYKYNKEYVGDRSNWTQHRETHQVRTQEGLTD